MTKQELVKILIENFQDKNGNIDITDLDFGDFEGDMDISGIKINGNIWQCGHENQGHVMQQGHENKGKVYQDREEL